jgi:hypothetical protein
VEERGMRETEGKRSRSCPMIMSTSCTPSSGRFRITSGGRFFYVTLHELEGKDTILTSVGDPDPQDPHVFPYPLVRGTDPEIIPFLIKVLSGLKSNAC